MDSSFLSFAVFAVACKSGHISFIYTGIVYFLCGRRGGLMVRVLASGSSGPGSGPGPGPLCCVLGQDTLLSLCLSPPRCIKVKPVKLTLDIS